MGKSFKNFVGSGNNGSSSRRSQDLRSDNKNLFKYSLYMQSKSSAWLNRNISNSSTDDEIEPIEEDIRD